MSKISTRISVDDLPLGGFAGIVETQMVISPKIMPSAASRTDISHGLGSFIYLSTGYFKANDGAPIHPHENVDIVTLILSGKLAHKGTLGDGTIIDAPGVQVQRAGTGMQHAEFNPENTQAEFVQMWFLPPQNGLTPAYQDIPLKANHLQSVLGGYENFDNQMHCQIGVLKKNTQLNFDEPFIAFITQGKATINEEVVTKGDLIQGDNFNLQVIKELGLVIIQESY